MKQFHKINSLKNEGLIKLPGISNIFKVNKMNKTTRNLTALVLIGASTLFASGCSCRKIDSPVPQAQAAEKIDEQKGKTLDYIKQNPGSQEQIVNYIILSREKNKLGYSRETIDNFYNVVREEIKRNPKQMKDELVDITRTGLCSDYAGEIFASLPFKEKMRITKECSLYELKEAGESAKELDKNLENYQPKALRNVNDAIRKGLDRANIQDAKERVKRDATEFYENVKEKVYGNN